MYYSSNGKIILSEEQLKELIQFCSKKAVGKCLKRFEIHNNIPALKNELRELLYESFRDTMDLIIATSKGLGLTQIQFKNSKGKVDSKAS